MLRILDVMLFAAEGKSSGASKRYWMGDTPIKCEVCYRELQEEFIDGATRRGPWAMMCPTCHELFGFGLGTGVGQKYTLGDHGRWWKTGG